jgi:hypothetical protein
MKRDKFLGPACALAEYSVPEPGIGTQISIEYIPFVAEAASNFVLLAGFCDTQKRKFRSGKSTLSKSDWAPRSLVIPLSPGSANWTSRRGRRKGRRYLCQQVVRREGECDRTTSKVWESSLERFFNKYRRIL